MNYTFEKKNFFELLKKKEKMGRLLTNEMKMRPSLELCRGWIDTQIRTKRWRMSLKRNSIK